MWVLLRNNRCHITHAFANLPLIQCPNLLGELFSLSPLFCNKCPFSCLCFDMIQSTAGGNCADVLGGALCRVCMFSPCMRRFYSCFLPPSKNMHVVFSADSKLTLGVSVSVEVSRLSLCGPVMDWQTVQGVPRLSPNDSWNELQPPVTLNWSGLESGWMDLI